MNNQLVLLSLTLALLIGNGFISYIIAKKASAYKVTKIALSTAITFCIIITIINILIMQNSHNLVRDNVISFLIVFPFVFLAVKGTSLK